MEELNGPQALGMNVLPQWSGLQQKYTASPDEILRREPICKMGGYQSVDDLEHQALNPSFRMITFRKIGSEDLLGALSYELDGNATLYQTYLHIKDFIETVKPVSGVQDIMKVDTGIFEPGPARDLDGYRRATERAIYEARAAEKSIILSCCFELNVALLAHESYGYHLVIGADGKPITEHGGYRAALEEAEHLNVLWLDPWSAESERLMAEYNKDQRNPTLRIRDLDTSD